MSCSFEQIVSSDSTLSYSDQGVGEQGRFDAFAAALGRELAPGSVLERVLAERAILSAWTMQRIAAKQRDAIKNPQGESRGEESPEGRYLTGGHVDLSPQGVFLVTHCLEKTLDALDRLRALPALHASPPAPAVADVSSEAACDSDLDPDTVFDRDSELDGDSLADFSNEWPVVPRGRMVEDFADADADDPACVAQGDEPLADRWRGRLVFDLDVSEDSPVVKGTWVTVCQVVSRIVDGWTWSDILRAHPELTEDDLRTCLAYTVAEDDRGR